MTLTELRYITTLADERHFGRAAERCFVSQPTLSVAVKKLEDELGIVLFERYKGNIQVSEAGARLIEQAEAILQQVQVFKELAEAGKEQLSTPLKLGAIYTIGPYLFPALMPGLATQAPNMPLYIEENYTAVLKEKLRRCELDAIIVALPFDDPEIETALLYQEDLLVALPQGHRLADEKQITGNMLLDDNLLMLGPGHCFREQVLDACGELQAVLGTSNERKSSPQQLITEGSSLETIRHMVTSGLGISVLPQSAVQGRENQRLLLRPFAQPGPRRSVALAWRTSFPRPQAIEILRQCIEEVRPSLSVDGPSPIQGQA